MPPLGTRFEMLEETLRLVRLGWQDELGSRTALEGRHYQAGHLLNSPQALTRPHPPILIGGGGERRTLRLVAHVRRRVQRLRHGSRTTCAHKFGVLRRHCEAVGRDYDSIEKTLLTTISITPDGARRSLTPDALVERLGRTADVGAQHAIVSVRDVHDLSKLELIGARRHPAAARVGATVSPALTAARRP